MLSSPQIEGFLRDGFVVCRGLLPENILAPVRDAILAAVEDDPSPPGVLYRKVHRELTVPCFVPELLAIGEELVGPDLRRGPGYSPFLEDHGEEPYFLGYAPVLRYPQSGPKAFVAPKMGWHVDGYRGVTLYPTLNYLVVFAYLTDVVAYGGATAVRPGSHRQLFAHWHRHGGVHDHELPDLPWKDPVPVVGQAGDVILMHYLCVHAASDNFSDRIRVGLNSAIQPDPGRPYTPKSGPPTPDWTPLDHTLRTDTL